MNKEEFIEFINTYKEYRNCSYKLYELGIDLTEENSNVPLQSIGEKMFDQIINSLYTEYGIDWVNWFVYETDFQEKEEKYGAWDGEQLICQSVEELYDYIEKYKK